MSNPARRVEAHQITTTAVMRGWHVWNDFAGDMVLRAMQQDDSTWTLTRKGPGDKPGRAGRARRYVVGGASPAGAGDTYPSASATTAPSDTSRTTSYFHLVSRLGHIAKS